MGPVFSSLHFEFPESLSVSGKHQEIVDDIAAQQLAIVCCETDSGKTTRILKIALAMGKLNYRAVQRGKFMGHSQSRRISVSALPKG